MTEHVSNKCRSEAGAPRKALVAKAGAVLRAEEVVCDFGPESRFGDVGILSGVEEEIGRRNGISRTTEFPRRLVSNWADGDHRM